MKQMEGTTYKGQFWPAYWGGVLFNSETFGNHLMDGICPTLRAGKNDAATCVEYDDGKCD